MDKKILQAISAKPKTVVLFEPYQTEKSRRGFRLRFNYGFVDKRQITKDVALKLDYNHSPSNPLERQQNKLAHKEANTILDAVRTMVKEGKYPIIGSNSLKDSDNNFVKWYSKQIEDNSSYIDNTKRQHRTTINHLKSFAGDIIPFENLDHAFITKFYDFLKNDAVNTKGNSVPANTAIKYHSNFYHYTAKASKLFNFKLADNVSYAQDRKDSKPKEYLTKEELQKLINTPEPNILVRNSFLFGCFTSLALEECIHVKYYDVKKNNEGRYYLDFQRKKTSNYNQIPLTNNALDIIEQMRVINGDSTLQSVFKGLRYSENNNKILQYWVYRAGINKKITPHCARNTFSAMHFDKYKDYGMLMKILGHKDMSTTQRYLTTFLKSMDIMVDDLPEFDLNM